MDYALTTEQMLRIGYSQNASSRRNLGIGGFDLSRSAPTRRIEQPPVRMQETGPVVEPFLNTLRATASIAINPRRSSRPRRFACLWFYHGGAQVRGGRQQRDAELTSYLNYVRGIHTVRTGIQLEGGTTGPTAPRYLGTFIFSSGEDFQNGRPRNYTRRIGDRSSASRSRAAAYVQDDLRLRPNLTFSPGLRYEVQTRSRLQRPCARLG